jgi:hypothetical protein
VRVVVAVPVVVGDWLTVGLGVMEVVGVSVGVGELVGVRDGGTNCEGVGGRVSIGGPSVGLGTGDGVMVAVPVGWPVSVGSRVAVESPPDPPGRIDRAIKPAQ